MSFASKRIPKDTILSPGMKLFNIEDKEVYLVTSQYNFGSFGWLIALTSLESGDSIKSVETFDSKCGVKAEYLLDEDINNYTIDFNFHSNIVFNYE